MQSSPAPRPLSDLPGPRGWPLLGNVPQIDFTRFHQRMERWMADYGSPFRVRLGRERFMVTDNMDAIQGMLRERPGLFRRRSNLERIFDELGLNGVFSAEGENWQRQRRIVVTALNSAHLQPFYATMKTITARLEQRWRRAAETGAVVDLPADLMRYTVDITTQMAFGIDFNTLETDGPVIQHQLNLVFPAVSRRLGTPVPYWRLFKLAKDRALDRAVAGIREQVIAVIAEARQRLTDDPARRAAPANFLEAMLAAQLSEQLPFTDDDIIANVGTLLLAGEDTTANTIAWAMKFFIDLPAVTARVRSEVDALLGAATIPPDHASASQQPLLEAFANETLRLKPVVPLMVMEALEDTVVQGVKIPAGTGVFALCRHMATRADNFSAPAEFRLERWTERGTAEAGTHNARAFVPFGGGPRFCPGRNLALLEIKVVLAMFLRNFELELADPAQPVEEEFAFTMGPKKLDVRLRARRG